MTGRQYIEEVKMRLARHEVVLNLNDALILTYVNMARKQIEKITMNIFPERYGKILAIDMASTDKDLFLGVQNNYANQPVDVYDVILPGDFLEMYVAILQWEDANGVTIRREIRRMTKTEMYNVQMQSWDGPSIYNPVYTIDRAMVQGQGGDVYIAYITGFNLYDTLGQTLFDIATNVKLEAWYIAALPDIELMENEPTITDDYAEMVIYYAMMYCLEDIREQEIYQVVLAEKEMVEKSLRDFYDISKMKTVVFIPSKEE